MKLISFVLHPSVHVISKGQLKNDTWDPHIACLAFSNKEFDWDEHQKLAVGNITGLSHHRYAIFISAWMVEENSSFLWSYFFLLFPTKIVWVHADRSQRKSRPLALSESPEQHPPLNISLENSCKLKSVINQSLNQFA